MKRLAFSTIVAGFVCLVLAYYSSYEFASSFLLGMSGNLIALGLGVIAVNIYLDNKSKRSAVRALLGVTQHHVTAFHNAFLTASWAHFGKNAFTDTVKEYMGSNGNPEALSQATRDDIYQLYKDSPNLQQLLVGLDEALTELSRLAGWSLSPDVLEASLKTRLSISKLRSADLDDSSESKTYVTEHLLDTDIQSALVLQSLANVAGIDFFKGAA